MKPGTVVVVDFQGVTGRKRRPALVVSSDTYHSQRPDLIVALITSQIAKATSKTDHILRDWESAGLDKPSAIRIFLQTYPANLCSQIGVLSDFDWNEAKEVLKLSIAY